MKLIVSITLGFIVPLIAGILVIGILTLTSVYSHIPTWSNTIGQSLKTEETRTITIRRNNRANLTAQTFLQFENDIFLIRDYAVSLFSNKLNVAFPYPNYFGVSSIDPTTPPNTINQGSNYSTSWFDKTVTSPTTLRTYSHPFLNQTTTMYNVWQSIFKSNPAYRSIYIGMNNGLFRGYPYSRLNRFPTLIYTCVSSNQQVTGYDPRCRSWYALAKANTNKVIFTAPYSDASSGDTLISIAHAIVVNGGNLVGVISVDISMDQLDKKILSTRILDNGYTYLIDQTGNAVIHPSIDRSKIQTIQDLEFSKTSERNSFQPILNNIKNGKNGEQTFTKNGQTWFISYGPVPNLPYRMAMVVPQSDIDKAAHQIQRDANATVAGGVAFISVFFVIIIVASIYINIQTAKRLAEPILDFIEYLDKIKKGDLDVELGNKAPVSAEINVLSENLGNLLHAVRFGNDSYYKGDFQKALDNFELVEKMMIDFQNERGLGVCLNNKANVLAQMNNRLNEAKEYYDKAIENALSLKERTENRDEINAFNIVLANRYMNLGVYYKSMNNFNEAKRLFDKSLHLHKKTDNLVGIAKVSGNVGQLCIEMGDFETAREAIEHALDISKDRGDPEALQICAMNSGLLEEACTNIAEAMQWYRYALDCCQYNPNKNPQLVCLKHLSECYYMIGNNQLGDQILELLSKSRNVAFVLDVSGSMSGAFIYQCRDSIKRIINDFIGNDDNVSLTIFSTNVSNVFPMKPKRGNVLDMIQKIDTKTKAGGGTAFYDAVYYSMMSEFKDGGQSDDRENWMIALTDGEDNKSRRKPAEVIQLIGASKVNLLIITVGTLDNESTIRAMCNACRGNGVHIQAKAGVNGIATAFEKAAKMIASDLNMEQL